MLSPEPRNDKLFYLTIVFGQLGPTLLAPDDPGSKPQVEKLPGTNCFGTSSQIAHLENVEFGIALIVFLVPPRPQNMQEEPILTLPSS